MAFGTKFRDQKEYNTECIIKTGDQGTTEIVTDKQGTKYIRKQIPYIGLPYDKLQKLSLDGVPRIYNVEELTDNGSEQTKVIEEKIVGMSLAELLTTEGKLSEETVKNIMLSLCDILIELHRQGILHRDIKPSNIMIDGNNKVWLIDFGSARKYKEEYEETKDQDTYVMVTRTFAPPEQYGSGVTTPKSDIYSFGKTMLYLLGGDYVGELRCILDQCTKDDPEQRFPSVVELKASVLNPNKVLRNLYLAALSGDSKAQYDLGCYYDVSKKYIDAVHWLQKSFNQEALSDSFKADAAFRLGKIFQYDLADENRLGEAKKFYELAKKYGHDEADIALDNLKNNGTTISVWLKIVCRRLVKNSLFPIALALLIMICGLSGYIVYNNSTDVRERNRENAEMFLALGDEVMLKEDWKQGLSFYNKGLVLDDNNPKLYFARACAYLKKSGRNESENKQIITDFKRALDCKENILDNYRRGVAYFGMGSVYFELKDYKNAIDSHTQALKLIKDQAKIPIILSQQGISYRLLNDYNSSLKAFDESLEKFAELRNNRKANAELEGNVYKQRADLYAYNLNNKDKALADYNVAVKMSTNNPHIFFNRGMLLWLGYGDKNKALNDFNKTLEIDSSYQQAAAARKQLLASMK